MMKTQLGTINFSPTEILEVSLKANAVVIGLADGTTVTLTDDGQDCCEYRYFSTDDNHPEFVGAKLHRIACEGGRSRVNDADECEDVQFIKVDTDQGTFTIKAYNLHNGYYAGFDIAADVTPSQGVCRL